MPGVGGKSHISLKTTTKTITATITTIKIFFFFNKSLSAPDVEAEVKFPGHLLR